MSASSNRCLLTLVVATFGRETALLDLLGSIPADAAERLRIVVVDQNSSDRLTPLLRSARQDLSVEHLRVSFQNASRARTLGARHACTPWIAFPDDDAAFLPDALTNALELMEEPLDIVAGQIVDEHGAPHLLDWLTTTSEITPSTIDRCFVESSFFIRRDVFLSVGGFDSLFGPGGRFPAAEGADLIRRLWLRGMPLRTAYTPNIRLYHPQKLHDYSPIGRERIRNFAFAEGAFTARHFRTLALGPVARKLLFRIGGACISSGERRLRKLAYLRGFANGVRDYVGLEQNAWSSETA